jgi:hypothetical protein
MGVDTTLEFAGTLGRGVRRNGVHAGRVFVEWHGSIVSVHRRRRAEDESRDAEHPCAFEESGRSSDIDRLVHFGFSDARPDSGARGQVDDGIRALEPGHHHVPVTYVRFMKLECVMTGEFSQRLFLDPAIVERIEVVHPDHRSTGFEQGVRNVRTDEAHGTCDHYPLSHAATT